MLMARLSANGVRGNKYWYDTNYIKGANSSYGLGNCTHYAVGEEGESTQATGKLLLFRDRDPGGYPDAKEFYDKWLYNKGVEPKVGGILCWGTKSNTYGHVAFVAVDPVFLGNSKWRVKVSESCYSKIPSKSVYWRLKEYIVEPGKITTGVGMVYNGCCYNIKPENDIRTVRNKDRNQVDILVDDLSVRKSPNGLKWEGLFALKGLYNILETQLSGNYTWAKLENDCWVALNDKDNWTKTYKKETDYDHANLQVELDKAKNEIKSLKSDNERLQNLYNKELELLEKEKEETNRLVTIINNVKKALE